MTQRQDPPPTSGFDLVLYSPRIPQNVGGIGRLCAATNTPLHIVRPIPFQLDDRTLRRSAMDYWDHVELSIHDDFPACRAALALRRLWLFSTRGRRAHWDADFRRGDVLLFGSEPAGVPEDLHAEIGVEHTLRVPLLNPAARSLNLSMAAGIGLYEALRQIKG